MGIKEMVAARKAAENSERAAHDTAQSQPQPLIVPDVQDTHVEIEHDERPHLWSATHSEAFKIQLAGGEVQAKDGLLKLTNAEHKELLALLKTGRPDIAQNIVHLNPAEAEKIALDHMKRHQRPAATKGALASTDTVEKGGAFLEKKPVIIPGASEAQNNRIAAQGSTLLAVEESDAMHAEDSNLAPAMPNSTAHE